MLKMYGWIANLPIKKKIIEGPKHAIENLNERMLSQYT
jgi:hypothetical protein